MGSVLPGGYSTVMIKTSRPGLSVRSFDMSDVTLACCAITVPVERNSRTIMSFIFFIIDLSFLAGAARRSAGTPGAPSGWPRPGNAFGAPAGSGRLARKAVPRHRRNDQVKRVRGLLRRFGKRRMTRSPGAPSAIRHLNFLDLPQRLEPCAEIAHQELQPASRRIVNAMAMSFLGGCSL